MPWLLFLFTFAALMPVFAAIEEGKKSGGIGILVASLVGLGIGVAWFSILWVVKARLFQRLRSVRMNFWVDLSMAIFFAAVIASVYLPMFIAVSITRIVIQHVVA